MAVTDVNLDAARAVARGVGGRALALLMDVTSEGRWSAGSPTPPGRWAGSTSRWKTPACSIAPITEFALSDWRRVLSIHLDGGFLLTRAAMRHWQAAGKGGLLLYMGSVHSVEASPLKSAYVAAKHGLWVWPGRRRRKGEDRRAHQRHLPGFRPHPAGGSRSPSERRRASARRRW